MYFYNSSSAARIKLHLSQPTPTSSATSSNIHSQKWIQPSTWSLQSNTWINIIYSTKVKKVIRPTACQQNKFLKIIRFSNQNGHTFNILFRHKYFNAVFCIELTVLCSCVTILVYPHRGPPPAFSSHPTNFPQSNLRWILSDWKWILQKYRNPDNHTFPSGY